LPRITTQGLSRLVATTSAASRAAGVTGATSTKSGLPRGLTLAGGLALGSAVTLGAAWLVNSRPDPSDTRNPPAPLKDPVRGASYVNPVFDGSAPDPTVIRARGEYYAYTTSTKSGGERYRNIPVLGSKDLSGWKMRADALPKLPAWAQGAVWAPHITHHKGMYQLYFAVQEKGTNDFHVGLATSRSPEGPFKPAPKPVLRGIDNHYIDPFVFADRESGRRYLYVGSGNKPIKAFELNEAGDGVRSTRGRTQIETTGKPYEKLVEAPWITERDGKYYMFYSGDDFEKHYAVRVARSDSPLGPWEKQPGKPLLEGNRAFQEPGHNAVATDDRGKDWMIYHAFEGGHRQEGRKLLLDRIDWGRDGWPRMTGGQGPTSTVRAVPQRAQDRPG